MTTTEDTDENDEDNETGRTTNGRGKWAPPLLFSRGRFFYVSIINYFCGHGRLVTSSIKTHNACGFKKLNCL